MTPEIRVLDCESYTTALQSLAALFSCKPDELARFLSQASLEARYVGGYCDTVSFENFILGQVSERFGAPSVPERVCWFHCTRVPQGTRFAEGILPLGAMLPQLETVLASLVANPNNQALVRQVFGSRGGHAFQFRLKTGDSLHWGPYAILVRDVAFHTRALGQHDYLGMPEIVDDLCAEVEAIAGVNLTAEFEAALVPAIVKFSTPARGAATGAVSAALCYVWSTLVNGKPDGSSVCNFDGGNVAVPAKTVLSVEFVSGKKDTSGVVRDLFA